MILKAFRIQNHKCFDDSGWVDVDHMTVFIGKNESGKTSLLQALHKFNSTGAEGYNMRKEWPRGKRKRRDNKAKVCTCKFELTENDLKIIKKKFNLPVNKKEVLVHKNYDNEFDVDLSQLVPVNLNPKNSESVSVQQLKEHVIGLLPKFVYMSDNRVFKGSAQLDELKKRKDQKQLTEQDKATLMILELSGLDLEAEIAKANEEDLEDRQYDLDDASTTLTNVTSKRWSQREYEIKLNADGLSFFMFVRDSQSPSLIKLEERSKGFQWFFSFDLVFMYESHGGYKNSVILVDEPGLHLHPEGQKDLLNRLKAYTKENTMLYTTNLPVLVDLAKPECVRTISETSEGAKVSSMLKKS